MTLITEIQRLAAASGAPSDAEAYDRVTRVRQLQDERKRDRTSLTKERRAWIGILGIASRASLSGALILANQNL